MALVESHNCSWEASGCAIRSFLVCFSYDFRAASKMAWKREEAVVDVEAIWDMGAVKESKIILCEGPEGGNEENEPCVYVLAVMGPGPTRPRQLPILRALLIA